ncbi:hypothetical protein HYN56_10230 [Flavobacterium crocinum]|uniref:DUF4595 domain-containing protein n=1 Tax=Flavobacterium crocinum TaxID=2183896 RepID=A0A2S1YKL2_9FLAO|nr:hypothetical protein [Flavobacterium crocinum]AWK04583.1 hypothetical protein HYN56_10230 [Flavobacterium crocinum]
MKKILCLFGALALVLTSCSSDDSSSESADAVLLPKKITETTVEDGQSGSLTYTLSYDGNKLKEISLSDASRSAYTYTGNQITKVELFRSGVLYATEVYAYDGEKLVSKITTREANKTIQDKLTFVYNANGTVNVNQSQIIDRQEIKYDTTTLYTLSNGNMISSELIDGVLVEKITSTFDTKKSPFINITGVKALLDLDFNTGFDFYSANNTVKNVTVTYSSNGAVTQTATVETKYKYNNSNYATEIFSGDARDSYKLEVVY